MSYGAGAYSELPYSAEPAAAGGAGVNIAVPAATLTLTAYAPTVTAGHLVDVSVPAGGLTLVGYAPTVTTGEVPVVTEPETAATGGWPALRLHRIEETPNERVERERRERIRLGILPDDTPSPQREDAETAAAMAAQATEPDRAAAELEAELATRAAMESAGAVYAEAHRQALLAAIAEERARIEARMHIAEWNKAAMILLMAA